MKKETIINLKSYQDWFAEQLKKANENPGAVGYGMMIRIAGNLAIEANNQGLSWKELAEKIGVKENWVSRFFNCSEKTSMLSIMRVALALGLKPELDFTFTKEHEPDSVLMKAKEKLENYNLNLENRSFSKYSHREEIVHKTDLKIILENLISWGIPQDKIINIFDGISFDLFEKDDKNLLSSNRS